MFRILITLEYIRGRIQWGCFKEGAKIDIGLLADNLAGCLNNFIEQSCVPPWEGPGGLFYWE